ncbi:MAG: class IV adenylate cyclase [Phycisphaerae bacterium]|nr:class IV adenylate cyclase [Phycisphaerae bacterium]
MCLEVELKIKVDDLTAVAGRLADLGAAHRDDFTHLDTFYGDAEGVLIRAGSALRLRRQAGRAGEKAVLTYKGPRQNGRFKTRKEIEVEIADPDAMDALLAAMGCRRELVLEKRRTLWEYQECDVCLDELPILGSFVEVEGASEEVIEEVSGDLGLDTRQHISKGYAGMIRRYLGRTGSTDRQVLFER